MNKASIKKPIPLHKLFTLWHEPFTRTLTRRAKYHKATKRELQSRVVSVFTQALLQAVVTVVYDHGGWSCRLCRAGATLGTTDKVSRLLAGRTVTGLSAPAGVLQSVVHVLARMEVLAQHIACGKSSLVIYY